MYILYRIFCVILVLNIFENPVFSLPWIGSARLFMYIFYIQYQITMEFIRYNSGNNHVRFYILRLKPTSNTHNITIHLSINDIA